MDGRIGLNLVISELSPAKGLSNTNLFVGGVKGYKETCATAG